MFQSNGTTMKVVAVNMSGKRDLPSLMAFLTRFGEKPSVTLVSKKRSKDVPFIYVNVTQETSLPAEYAFHLLCLFQVTQTLPTSCFGMDTISIICSSRMEWL